MTAACIIASYLAAALPMGMFVGLALRRWAR
jgi:hypothetical protein